VDKSKTNQCDGREDVGLTGPDVEEIMGETLKVSLHDLLLCLGTLSSSGEGRCRFQLSPSDSLLDGPALSERHLGSPSISSSQQVSNPFSSSQPAASRSFWNQNIQCLSYSATLLIHLQRCLFRTPCWRSSGQQPISTARGGFPFWFFTVDRLTILHPAGGHH
jgi:hypothetical protein